MLTYKVIYPWEVIEKIKQNPNIYMLDRQQLVVTSVETMEVGDFASVLAIADKEQNRFEFWEERKETENEQ